MSASSARVIDGKALALRVRNEVADRVQHLKKHGITPGLTVVLVGADPASQVYVRNKALACEKAGMKSDVIKLPASTTQAELLALIERLNADNSVHGILVQLPLPAPLDEHAVIEAISAAKDVDGFHISNAGLLLTGQPLFRPCTPYGVMKMLEDEGVNLRGAEAVIIGASNIVGKPMALMLQAAGATITICNSKTKDLAAHTRRADVLVVATGRPRMITADMVKPGAVVIDVGINRLENGQLTGDVDYEAVSQVAAAITPVPGGVGPMTIAMLLVNTVEAAERLLAQANPLLVPISQLIDYAAIQAEHIEPAITELLNQARSAVSTMTEQPTTTWANTVQALNDATEQLSRAWTVVGHLNSVINSPELRAARTSCLPLMSEFSTWLGQHQGLYQKYKVLAQSEDFSSYNAEQQRAITLALRDFRLSGVELEGEARTRYGEISEQQALASQRFSENVLDSMDQWALYITDATELDGIPADTMTAFATAAKADAKEGWKINLQMPSYLPVMQYATNRDLRHTLYKAYATVASDQGANAKLDNSTVIETALALRAEESALLGYSTFADLRLETRMADTPPQVIEFLRDLAQRALPFARQDMEQLTAYATTLGINDLQPWDVAFVSEKLRQDKYAYSADEVKQYFTEPQVMQGLFDVAQQLFGVSFKPVAASVWHADVKAYEVFNDQQQHIGYLYTDLYARNGKQGGAWVNSERSRRLTESGIELPITYLVCNFSSPQEGKPACLTHDDVITLFHESGHALHNLLSTVDEPDVSAFAAVEWDAIELPSQFMENFCWEYPVIAKMSAHVDTGATLPFALYEKLLAAKNFQSGMQMVRQIEFSLFDMLIHSQSQGLTITEVLAILDQVRTEVAVIIPPSWHRFPHAFSHLFAGGYGAGYYSYKWAEVLSADAYGAFEENATVEADGSRNTLHQPTGIKFRDEVLAIGGVRPAAESFTAFRGREPSPEALLRHSGLIN